MPSFEISDDQLQYIDFDSQHDIVRNVRPTVYKDGHLYCCLSGADPETGEQACGSTIEEALEKWMELWKKKNYS